MKKYILLIVIIAVIGAIVGFNIYNKPHENITSAKASHTLSATELFAAYEANEADANATYLDKIIVVKGKVRETKKENESVIVMLESDDMMFGVSCQLDNLTDHKRTKFEEGEEVTFKGKCTGSLMDVVMVRCIEI